MGGWVAGMNRTLASHGHPCPAQQVWPPSRRVRRTVVRSIPSSQEFPFPPGRQVLGASNPCEAGTNGALSLPPHLHTCET